MNNLIKYIAILLSVSAFIPVAAMQVKKKGAVLAVLPKKPALVIAKQPAKPVLLKKKAVVIKAVAAKPKPAAKKPAAKPGNKVILVAAARKAPAKKAAALVARPKPVAAKRTAQPAEGAFRFIGASVIPYTDIDGVRYYLLAREAGGHQKGTYDAFGGKKENGEIHAYQTAGRELAEEAALRLGNPAALTAHIDPRHGHTGFAVANERWDFVTYFTHFPQDRLQNLTHTFYAARNAARAGKYKEKDKLAWVSAQTFAQAIAQAQWVGGRLQAVVVPAQVVQEKGGVRQENITLRWTLVRSLQSHFQGRNAQRENDNVTLRYRN